MATLSRDAAEGIAIQALGFIAADATLLGRFLDLTGISAAEIRSAAGEPGFAAGVLQFICAHELTLIAFSEASGVAPAAVMAAKQALPGGEEEYQRAP